MYKYLVSVNKCVQSVAKKVKTKSQAKAKATVTKAASNDTEDEKLEVL